MRHPTARRSVLPFAAAVTLAAAAGVASAAETYKVTLSRPVKVGQAYAVTCRAEVNEVAKVSVNGQPQDKTDKFTAELTGTVKVEAVDDKGVSVTKLTLTVGKLTKGGADVLPAGTVVTADHTGAEESFTVDGNEVEPDEAKVLQTVIDVDKPDRSSTDDEMLGTADAQPVGGTWPGDPAKVVRTLNESGLPVSADGAKVTSKLTGVMPVNGVPSEVVESTLDCPSFDLTKPMQGLTLTEGTMSVVVTETLPVDPTLPGEAEDEHLKTAFKGHANAKGTKVTADVTVERTVHRTTTATK